MNRREIEQHRESIQAGNEWLGYQIAHTRWLKEIALQFATLNDTLASDVTFNVNIRHEDNLGFWIELTRIVEDLEALARPEVQQLLFKENRKRMPLSTAEAALVERFNKATTTIADRIKKLIEDAATMDDAEFNAQLTAIADGLEALGAPTEPIPGPGPQPTA